MKRFASEYRVPLESLSLVLGLVEYGNDHLMLERAKFNKLELYREEEQCMTSNAIALCLLKQYVSCLRNNFVSSFCRFADYFRKA